MALLKESRGHFEELKSRFQQRPIVLFIGLGVSSNSGLPSWEELTRRVFAKIPGGKGTLAHLAREGHSEPAKLAWARQKLGDDFVSVLRDGLYGESTFPVELEKEISSRKDSRLDKKNDELRRKVRRQNPTLAAIGALTVKKAGKRWVPNPEIHAVLTTNADTLLARYVEAAYGRAAKLRTVERASAGTTKRQIPVYHLHGMLAADPYEGLSGEAPDKLVFTELEYFRAYRDSFSIFTYTPLLLFREHTTFFIGTGLADPNIRRLLYWAQWEIAEGYREEGKPLKEEKVIRHYALMKASDHPKRGVTCELLEPLSVVPLWYEDHPDVPGICAALQAPRRA